MKRLILTVFSTVILGCFFGKAQVILQASTPPTPAAIATSPSGISEFEVRNKLITQNAFLGLGLIPAAQQTGSFGTSARWNSMGSLIPASGSTILLNGFRTQTDGRGLTMGYSTSSATFTGSGLNPSLSHPFIEWIGNSGVTPGNLDFNYATLPTGGGRVSTFTIQPVTPAAPFNFNAYAYARENCLLGQLQSGVYGGLGSTDKWVGIGDATTTTSSYIGTRVQSNGANLITGVEAGTGPIIQFNTAGNNTLPSGLKFRGDDGTSISELMRMDVQGRIDMGAYVGITSLTLAPFNYNLFVSGKNANSGTTSNDQIGVGLYARPSSPLSTLSNFSQYAVYGEADGGIPNGRVVGIYGTVNNPGISDYAGYFNGNVLSTGVFISSDKRLKKDVKEEVSALEKIMQLKPVSYTYDKSVSRWMNLEYNKTSHGFIADEVKEIFPEMVNEFAEPVRGTAKELQSARTFKAVNYMQLISVLTKGMQEQQAEINALKKQIETSTTLLLNNKTVLPVDVVNNSFALSQNAPNPFSEKTTITYTIPSNAKKAVLAIFDLNGRMLLQYNLQQGKNTLTVNGNTLAAGMYIYSLIADGQEVVSKRMVVTK
ncbi:MAG: tail fiber domain-containing protein [Ferruginibacter sp.]|nr:tail fiber domain-containing protein [Ferruginibacter sp.]